jgi:hypothetical protein
MRPTLHDYVEHLNEAQRPDVIMEYMANAFRKTLKFAKLTNRTPRLGDFVPCDENGNVLKKPELLEGETYDGYKYHSRNHKYKKALNRVIFSGDWEVTKLGNSTWVQFDEWLEFLFSIDGECTFYGKPINRIEDLPLEIEFKDGVI